MGAIGCCDDDPKPNEMLEGICCFWGKTLTEERVFLDVRKSECVSEACLSFFALLNVFDSRSQNSLRKSVLGLHWKFDERERERESWSVVALN